MLHPYKVIYPAELPPGPDPAREWEVQSITKADFNPYYEGRGHGSFHHWKLSIKPGPPGRPFTCYMTHVGSEEPEPETVLRWLLLFATPVPPENAYSPSEHTFYERHRTLIWGRLRSETEATKPDTEKEAPATVAKKAEPKKKPKAPKAEKPAEKTKPPKTDKTKPKTSKTRISLLDDI